MTIKAEMSRVRRSKQSAMAAYDGLSRWYDWLASGSELPLARLGLKKLNIQPGERVLEIGSGTGQVLSELSALLAGRGLACGFDLSPGMLAMAQRRLTGRISSNLICLGQADAAAIPCKTSAFDVLFMSFVLELFDTPEISIVLSECLRVLKPEGRICVVALARDEVENIPLRLYEWFHEQLPSMVDCRPIYVQLALENAGFQIKDITRKWMWGLPVGICIGQKP